MAAGGITGTAAAVGEGAGTGGAAPLAASGRRTATTVPERQAAAAAGRVPGAVLEQPGAPSLGKRTHGGGAATRILVPAMEGNATTKVAPATVAGTAALRERGGPLPHGGRTGHQSAQGRGPRTPQAPAHHRRRWPPSPPLPPRPPLLLRPTLLPVQPPPSHCRCPWCASATRTRAHSSTAPRSVAPEPQLRW